MNETNGGAERRNDSASIYRAPESETVVATGGNGLAAYVGPKNAEYYAAVFERFEKQGGTVSWNWPAFFISSTWFLYRKMWLNSFLYWIVLPIVVTVVSLSVASLSDGGLDPSIVYYALNVPITFILVPIFANRLYYRHAQKKVEKVAASTGSPEEQSAELARIGGTSNIALIVLLVLGIAMMGVLAAIAIPAYQDYTIRAQVAEGLNLAAGPRAAVTERYMATGELVADNDAAGLPAADQITGTYVSSVDIYRGTIVIEYGNAAHPLLQGKSLMLNPDLSSPGVLDWTCGSAMIEPQHLPAACR